MNILLLAKSVRLYTHKVTLSEYLKFKKMVTVVSAFLHHRVPKTSTLAKFYLR